MKQTSRAKVVWAMTLVLSMAANYALAANANGKILPPNSTAYGKSLAEWLGIYWRSNYSGADLAQSKVGGVQLMPLPAGTTLGGTGTPNDPYVYQGQLEITLPPGTPFVLPLFAWVRERYVGYPNVADDPLMDEAVALDSAHPLLKIDGQVVLTEANKAHFYIPTTDFVPLVEYLQPSPYNSVAALSFQGAGIVCAPFTPGKHVIELYEPFIIPAGAYPALPDGSGQIYINTWIVTVSRR